MLRALGIIAAVIVLIALAGWLLIWLAWRDLTGAGDVADLPRVEVLSQLGIGATDADAILFEDGRDGWFAINNPAQLKGVEIGFFGTRLGDAMFGASHIPLYCSGDGKAVWALRAGRMLKELAFCSPNRMDLSALRPLSEPVTLRSDFLLRQEVEALQDSLASLPDRYVVQMPEQFEPYDQNTVIQTPAIWYRWGHDDPSGLQLRPALEAAVVAHLAGYEGQYAIAITERSAGEKTDFVQSSDGYVPGTTGPVLAYDGKLEILTGVNWLTRFRLTVSCQPAACAALEGFDAEPTLRPGRNMALLEQGLADRIRLDFNADATSWTEDDLRRATTTIGPVADFRYAVRWAEPRQ